MRSTGLLFGDSLKIDANGYMLSRVRELNKSLIENQKRWKERVRQLEEHNARVEQETALRVVIWRVRSAISCSILTRRIRLNIVHIERISWYVFGWFCIGAASKCN